MQKDKIIQRVQEIENAMIEGRKILENQMAHLNLLEGQKREALFWLSESEKSSAESAPARDESSEAKAVVVEGEVLHEEVDAA